MFMKPIVLSGLATVGSAHMLMSNPVPYGKSSLNNSPMNADGSDFPCKMRDGVYDAQGASNVYAQGSKQQLSFIGSAVHGGGSCQVSVTTDLKPNQNSVWKVIKSIEGGCPARNVAGNLEAGQSSSDKYDFTIPKELSAGNYTLAWTWFNKIGNREMYMNCAPLTVTGSAGSSGFMNTLPDMFVANVGKAGNGCQTEETTDVKFPNPGNDVDHFGVASALKSPPSNCGQGNGNNGGGNNGGSSPSAKPTAPIVTPAPTSQAPQAPSKTSKSIPGGAFITVSSKAPAASSVAPTNAPAQSDVTTSQPAAPTSAAPSAAPTGGNTPAGANAAYSPCTSEGTWNCIDGTSFQRCASGSWSPVQAMPEGVSCTAGESTNLAMNHIQNTKRAMRRAIRVAA